MGSSVGFSRCRRVPPLRRIGRRAERPTRRACARGRCSRCSTLRKGESRRSRRGSPEGSTRNPLLPRDRSFCERRLGHEQRLGTRRASIVVLRRSWPPWNGCCCGAGRAPGLLAAKLAHASDERRPRVLGLRKGAGGTESDRGPGILVVPRPAGVCGDHGEDHGTDAPPRTSLSATALLEQRPVPPWSRGRRQVLGVACRQQSRTWLRSGTAPPQRAGRRVDPTPERRHDHEFVRLRAPVLGHRQHVCIRASGGTRRSGSRTPRSSGPKTSRRSTRWRGSRSSRNRSFPRKSRKPCTSM